MVQLNVAGIWLLAFPRRRKLVGMGSAPGWDKVRAIRGRAGARDEDWNPWRRGGANERFRNGSCMWRKQDWLKGGQLRADLIGGPLFLNLEVQNLQMFFAVPELAR